jgi:hypothetical protein
MLAMSRWSNNESCSVPLSSNPLIAGAAQRGDPMKAG